MKSLTATQKLLFTILAVVVGSSLFLRFDRVMVFKDRMISKSTSIFIVPTTKHSKSPEDDIATWLQSVLKMHQKFQPKTSNSCNNTCTFKKEVCEAKDVDDWERIRTSSNLTAIPLFSNENSIFPWEREYLSHPPLNDINLLPSLSLSQVYYLAGGNNINFRRKIRCKNNDRLIFRVDLVDSYGNRRKFGGDDVRAWITNGAKKLSMAGAVKDMGNGTYIVTVTPVWSGAIKLNIAVIYPREYLRAALYHMKEGRHRFIFGLFNNSGVEEVTICHTTPNIPGRPCVCNYTTWNRRPYYCGRPLDERLTCQDWVAIKSAKGPTGKDYTPAEAIMASKMARNPDAATIKHNIVINAEYKDSKNNPLPPCVSIKNLTVTWNHQSPRGIWTRGKQWDSLLCKEPPLNSSWVKSCLKSSHFWLIGDSNLHMFHIVLKKELVPLKSLTPDKGYWSLERSYYNAGLNITTTFRGHEYPLFHYLTKGWVNLMNQGGIEDFLKRVPVTGSQIVVIHYNLHFAISHLSAIFQRFLVIRQAIHDVLERNPSTLIAIRGPHVSSEEWERNHLFGGDVQGKFILRLLHEIFKDLKDKIVFLDGWDMTISLKNRRMHPPNFVSEAMLRTLLAFKSG